MQLAANHFTENIAPFHPASNDVVAAAIAVTCIPITSPANDTAPHPPKLALAPEKNHLRMSPAGGPGQMLVWHSYYFFMEISPFFIVRLAHPIVETYWNLSFILLLSRTMDWQLHTASNA